MNPEWLEYLEQNHPELYKRAKAEMKWAVQWRDDEIALLYAENERLTAGLTDPASLHTHVLRTLSPEQIDHILGDEMLKLRAELKTAQDKLLPGGTFATQWECENLRAENERLRELLQRVMPFVDAHTEDDDYNSRSYSTSLLQEYRAFRSRSQKEERNE